MDQTTPAKKKQRTCVACGATDTKRALLRIVRSPLGVVSFDPSGRAPGRGAYVCSAECFAAARKAGKLDRALRTKLATRAVASEENKRSGTWPACEYMNWRKNSI